MPFIELRVQLHDAAFETNAEARIKGENLARDLSQMDDVYQVTIKDDPKPMWKDGEGQ